MSDSVKYCFLQVWTAQSDQETHDEFFKTFTQTIKACAFQDIAAETVYDSGRLSNGAFCLIKLKNRASVCIKAAKAILSSVMEIVEVGKGQLQLPERQILLCKKTNEEELVIEENTYCVEHWPRITLSSAAGHTAGSFSFGSLVIRGSLSHLQLHPNSQLLLGYDDAETGASTVWETLSGEDLLVTSEGLVSNKQGCEKLENLEHSRAPQILILVASSNTTGNDCPVALCDFNVNSAWVVAVSLWAILELAAILLAHLVRKSVLKLTAFILGFIVSSAEISLACCIQY